MRLDGAVRDTLLLVRRPDGGGWLAVMDQDRRATAATPSLAIEAVCNARRPQPRPVVVTSDLFGPLDSPTP